jgi:chromosome segregation ATPase
MMIVSGLHSQDDKIWIPRHDALRKLAQADSLPTYKQLVEAKQRDIDTLNERIKVKEQMIETLKSKEGDYKEIINLMQQEIDNDKKLREAFEGEISDLKKQVRKERRRTRGVAIAGIIATIAGIVFIK